MILEGLSCKNVFVLVMERKSEIENRRVYLFKDYLKWDSLALIYWIGILFKASLLLHYRLIHVLSEWLVQSILLLIVLTADVALSWSFYEMCVMMLNQSD